LAGGGSVDPGGCEYPFHREAVASRERDGRRFRSEVSVERLGITGDRRREMAGGGDERGTCAGVEPGRFDVAVVVGIGAGHAIIFCIDWGYGVGSVSIKPSIMHEGAAGGRRGQTNCARRDTTATNVVGSDAVEVYSVGGETGDRTRCDSADVEILIAGYKRAERAARGNVQAIAGGASGRSPVGGEAAGADARGGSGDRRGRSAGTAR